MELERHPEYRAYLQDRKTDRRWRQAVAEWVAAARKAEGEPIEAAAYSLRWTPGEARAFVRALSQMFREYNNVLWERFPYCRQCDGGCCVVGATRYTPFDAVALALLGHALPALPERIEAGERACRYHTTAGCVWPADWRPLKCWSFYCAQGEPTGPIVEQLEQVVAARLPGALQRYEAVHGEQLIAHLGDPVAFAGALDRALTAVFVEPLARRYPIAAGDSPADPACPPEETTSGAALDGLRAFVTEAAEQACRSTPPAGTDTTADQLLADLELLEWMMAGRPENGPTLLAEMLARYPLAPAPGSGERATPWHRMRGHVQYLLENWEQLSRTGCSP
jgi:hypothetical protein